MAQTLNTDVVAKLDAVSEVFRDGVLKAMRDGVENAAECAKKAGIPKLERSCEAAKEGTDSMIKVFTDMIDCVDKYKEYLKRVQSALD